MMKVTGERVAIGIILILVVSVIFTYFEKDNSYPQTMITLHNIELSSYDSTTNQAHVDRAFRTVLTSTPTLCGYTHINGTFLFNPVLSATQVQHAAARDRIRERSNITICTADDCSSGIFEIRHETVQAAWASFLLNLFVMLVWCMSVLSYALPVSALIVIPIERMVRFLGMLVKDPLGYQKTKAFYQFVEEEAGTLKKTGWRKEVVDGMETAFLMSTISRISNLVKVAFGSAGVEIIRSNLEEGAQNNVTFGNLVGNTVSCIFMFGDIRQFTDASECLQEEVFVFTNRIASVVHSICNSFDGSANKNIGDAFLVSWLLDEEDDNLDENDDDNDGGDFDFDGMMKQPKLVANDNQADKALLSVVRICIALQHDDYYLETIKDAAKKRLKDKMSERPGSLVQMGFGLHAGKAVQGAIGSERKLDATYISTAVDLAEYLESSTKKYGIKILMSGEFYGLLAKSSQRRCRKIDQIYLSKDTVEDNIYDARDNEDQDIMELYTHDMVVEDSYLLDKSNSGTTVRNEISSNISRSGLVSNTSLVEGGVTQARSEYSTSKGGAGDTMGISGDDSKKDVNVVRPPGARSRRRWSVSFEANSPSNENNLDADTKNELDQPGLGELNLPSGRVDYKASTWLKDDLRRTRKKFSHGRFYGPFNSALQLYFQGEWKEARHNFENVAERFDDNPSKYFLKKMKATNYVPPIGFLGYGSS